MPLTSANKPSAPEHDVFIAGETIDLIVPDVRALERSAWHTWFNDRDTTRFLEQGLFPQSLERQREYLDSINCPGGDRLVALIWAKDAGEFVGVGSLSHISWQHRRCETSLVIGRRKGGAGALFYGLEAKARLTEHAFDVLGLERVGGGQAIPLADWQKYQILFGFRTEGVARAMFRKGQETYDVVMSSCLLEDYRRVRAARGGAYWPGKAALLELMRQLPRESIVHRVRAAIDREIAAYLEGVRLDPPAGKP